MFTTNDLYIRIRRSNYLKKKPSKLHFTKFLLMCSINNFLTFELHLDFLKSKNHSQSIYIHKLVLIKALTSCHDF